MTLPTSAAFRTAIQAADRQVFGRVTIDYTDPPGTDASIAVSVNEQANVAWPAQTADDLRDPSARYASLDGTWVLGEAWALAPGTAAEAATHQMGWWGGQLAGTGGVFAAPLPTLTVTHGARPVWGLLVTGDSQRNEWPVDFTVRLLDGAGVVRHTEIVTGNTSVTWSRTIPQVLDITRQELVISRWSHAGRQAKILEFFTSIQETYEGDQIVSVVLLEEREADTPGLPVGSVTANELEVQLQNFDRRFDEGNPTSALRRLLRPGRRVRAWLGAASPVEWLPLGTFWTGEWHTSEQGGYVKTTARDRLDLLRQTTYATGVVTANQTLHALATAVLTDAGLRSGDFRIDAALGDIVTPQSWVGLVSHREALRLIAEAALGVAYCDRHGVIRVDGVQALLQQGIYLLPMFGALAAAEQITADHYFQRDQPQQWGRAVNEVVADAQPRAAAAVTEVYRAATAVPIAGGQTVTVVAHYTETPCIEAAASLVSAPAGASITAATHFAWGSRVSVHSPTAAGTFVLAINARPLRIQGAEQCVARDDADVRLRGVVRYVYPTNPLVQTAVRAQLIADTLLRLYRSPVRDVAVSWRGNPALELGDIVVVPDFGEQLHYAVVRQTLDFDGALRSDLAARRV